MDKEEFVVVIGRLKPMGYMSIYGPNLPGIERKAVTLKQDGEPICISVKLERIHEAAKADQSAI